MLESAVYVLNSSILGLCAVLLWRAYGAGRQRLLFWSALCFSGLAISNLLVFLDLVILPNVDLYFLRLVVAVVATSLLLFGLIWESDRVQ